MQEAAESRAWDPALRWGRLAVVCAAMVISAIDMTIVNVALPDISRDLNATLGELQWVLDGFLVALAGMLSVVSLTGLVFFLVEGAHAGWTAPPILAALALGIAGGACFVARELRARHPLLDVRILVRPRVAAGVVALLALYASFLGVMFLMPQYLQYVQERSAFVAGDAAFDSGARAGLLVAAAGLLVASIFVALTMRRPRAPDQG